MNHFFNILIICIFCLSCDNNETQLSDKNNIMEYNKSDDTIISISKQYNVNKISNWTNTLKEGRDYDTVVIGHQVWMAKNLNVSVFQNGDTIPNAETDKEWEKYGRMKEPAWCYYENEEIHGQKYGKLYNWYAVNDPRGLCPEGWRVPTKSDWEQLFNHYYGLSRDTTHELIMSRKEWYGVNESGFNAYPSGGRFADGAFEGLGSDGYFWSSTECGYDDRHAIFYKPGLGIALLVNWWKKFGHSVRCIKE